jgi:hypothetical protein
MKYLSLAGLALVLVFALVVSGMAVPMTLFFDNNDLDLGTNSQINVTSQYQALYGIWFQECYRAIDIRDPWVDPYPLDGANFSIFNGTLQQNYIVSVEGRINFDYATPYVGFDWWTIGSNQLTITAYNSVGISQGSFTGLGGTGDVASGSATFNGDISYLKFHDSGGFVSLSTLRYETPIPEPGTLMLLGTGLLGLGAFRFRRKK